jgi:Glutathione S-transferase, C-terminal domain
VALATGVEVTAILTVGYRVGEPIEKPALVGSLGVFDYVEDYLSKNPYFGGAEFTAADIMMHYAVRGAKLLVWIDAADYPHIAEWKRKVESRPAFERAAEAALPGGSDEFGLPAGCHYRFHRRLKRAHRRMVKRAFKPTSGTGKGTTWQTKLLYATYRRETVFRTRRAFCPRRKA